MMIFASDDPNRADATKWVRLPVPELPMRNLSANRRHKHHHQRLASRSSNGTRYHTHSLPPPRFTQNPLSLSMLESEWMCSRRPPAESNPQCTPPFLSRAAIERPDETQGLLRLTLTHQASTHWRAHSFPISCWKHGSPRPFF